MHRFVFLRSDIREFEAFYLCLKHIKTTLKIRETCVRYCSKKELCESEPLNGIKSEQEVK